jgi:hypothetical protein
MEGSFEHVEEGRENGDWKGKKLMMRPDMIVSTR